MTTPGCRVERESIIIHIHPNMECGVLGYPRLPEAVVFPIHGRGILVETDLLERDDEHPQGAMDCHYFFGLSSE